MKRKKIAAVALIGLMVLTGCGDLARKEPKETDTQAEVQTGTPVEVQGITRMTLSNESMVSGQIIADAGVSIVPTISGTVLQLPVKVGDTVKKGDLLFRIDTSQITSSYGALKQSYDATQRVTNEAIQNAQSALPIAQSALTTAQGNYDNSLALFNVGAASQIEVDQARTQLEQARNQLKQAQSAVTQARATQQAQLAQIEASLSQMNAQVAAATVTAPCDGLIVGVNITAGGVAAPSGPAITIAEGGRTRVSVQVSEQLLSQIKVGEVAKVTVPAVSNEPFNAMIASVAPAASAQTALYEVRLYTLLDVKYPIGAFAEVVFFTNQRRDAITVPSDAIVTDGAQSYIFTVSDNIARKIAVEPGVVGNGVTEILSGLSGAEKLVVKGQSYLTDGAEVRVVADRTKPAEDTESQPENTPAPIPESKPAEKPEPQEQPKGDPELVGTSSAQPEGANS